MTQEKLALLGGRPQVENAPPFTWPPITEGQIERIGELLRRGEISYYGREGELAELEDKFRDYLGVAFALGVSSGTTALHSAYFGLGLEPGDEVLAPAYTFLATVTPLLVANAVPVLVDADPVTANIDTRRLESHITERTRAIVVTHMWGNPVDMEAVTQVARRHGLKVVEDCSHAHGAKCRDRFVGTFGDVAVFSLQGKKLVSAGQGGMLVTNDREIHERATLLGHFNVRAHQEVTSERYRPFAETGFGLNYRMHALAAGLANAQMDHLEEYIAGRRANLGHLSRGLADVPGIDPPATGPHATRHAYYSYRPLYRGEELDGLPLEVYLEALRHEGVPIEKSSARPLHTTALFGDADLPLITHGDPESFAKGGKRRRYRDGDMPGSEDHARRALTFPAYTEPVTGFLDQVVAACRKVADNVGALHDHVRSR